MNPIHAITIGSNTAVTRFLTQQVLNNGDDIAGFAALQGGFALNGADVTATFSSEFAVSGDIELNFGTLILNRDLILHNVSSLGLLGDIDGNAYRLQLSTTSTCLPDISDNVRNCGVFLIDTVSINTLANAEVVAWSYDDKYLAIGGDASLAGPALFLYELVNNQLVFRDSALTGGGFTVNDIRWHPTEYLLTAVKTSGGTPAEINVFSVDSSGNFTLESSVAITANMNAAAWHPTGDYIAVGGDLTSSEILVYPVSSAGILDTAGVLKFDIIPNRVVQTEALDWDVTGSYLAVGLNVVFGSPTLEVYEFNDEPSLSLALNASITVGRPTTRVDWNRTSTDLLGMGVAFTTRIYRHDAMAGTLSLVTQVAQGGIVMGVDWSPDGMCYAVSTNNNFLGSHFRTYVFNEDAGSLTQVTNVQDTVNIQALRWAPSSGKYVAIGMDGSPGTVELYAKISEICSTFSNLLFILSDDTEIKEGCVQLSGNSIIDGRGSCLSLGQECEIQVASNSSLLLRDICIKGINSQKINLLDSSSTISLENVEWILDGNYSFSLGRFDVLQDWRVIGDCYTFAYQSDQVSTIQENATMILDKGLTFSYDPSIDSNTLLQLADDTAALQLNGATLYVSDAGLQLTKGRLLIDDTSCITSTGLVAADGVIFGDGSSVANNLTVQFLADSGIEVTSGFLSFQNVSC